MTSVRERPPTTRERSWIPWTSGWGMVFAGITAVISGVSVFVNSYAVKVWPDATAYTTAKNLIAAVVVLGALGLASTRGAASGMTRPKTGTEALGLLAVAVIGGSIPFVLFFEGLAAAEAKDAAFLHKTLVVWVAVLAVSFLHERVGWLQGAAVAALVVGQLLLGVDVDALRPGSGEAMILAATALWAVEVVVAKRLLRSIPPLTLASARLGGGTVLLVAWCAVTGRLASLWPSSVQALVWMLVTGGLLAAYAVSWLTALARAQAVDVTAVLVGGAVLTAILDGVVRGVSLEPRIVGLTIVACGVAAVVVRAVRVDRGQSPVVPLAERSVR